MPFSPNSRTTYNTVNTNLVDGLVDAQKIDEIGAERILGREPDLDAVGLDKLDNLNGGLVDVVHVLAVRVLTEERRGANNDVAAFALARIGAIG